MCADRTQRNDSQSKERANGVLTRLGSAKIVILWGSDADSAGGAYDAPQTLYGRGTHPPISAVSIPPLDAFGVSAGRLCRRPGLQKYDKSNPAPDCYRAA